MTYERNVQKLESRSYKNFALDYYNILDVINKATTCDNINSLNIVHDINNNKLKIYNQGRWGSYLFEQGAKDLITTIQSGYLDYYEKYLLRKAHHSSAQCIREILEEYFKFLICFELDPFIKHHSDAEILGEESNLTDEYTLYDMFYKTYKERSQVQ